MSDVGCSDSSCIRDRSSSMVDCVVSRKEAISRGLSTWEGELGGVMTKRTAEIKTIKAMKSTRAT